MSDEAAESPDEGDGGATGRVIEYQGAKLTITEVSRTAAGPYLGGGKAPDGDWLNVHFLIDNSEGDKSVAIVGRKIMLRIGYNYVWPQNSSDFAEARGGETKDFSVSFSLINHGETAKPNTSLADARTARLYVAVREFVGIPYFPSRIPDQGDPRWNSGSVKSTPLQGVELSEFWTGSLPPLVKE